MKKERAIRAYCFSTLKKAHGGFVVHNTRCAQNRHKLHFGE